MDRRRAAAQHFAMEAQHDALAKMIREAAQKRQPLTTIAKIAQLISVRVNQLVWSGRLHGINRSADLKIKNRRNFGNYC